MILFCNTETISLWIALFHPANLYVEILTPDICIREDKISEEVAEIK